ncbi:ecdysone oxidase-like [Atheta coriaria]|uniref:ecdysone oxidase-like n=1 Tax=Dalotia coriaria TaxID=877792 RepID=UPI0031F3F27A
MVKRRVNKFIFEGTTAVDVEVQDPNGVVMIKPTREIIITPGAINSPKLLMLSGIGLQEHLEELGIPVYADLPVGQYLEDHLIVPVFATILDVPMPPYNLMRDAFCTIGTLLNNIELANFIGFLTLKEKLISLTFFEKFGIIEEFASQLRDANQLHSLLLFLPTLLHPVSRREMFLQNLDLKRRPRLFPHDFEEGDDAQVVIDSIYYVQLRLLQVICFEYESDEYWRCYCTHLAGTI